MGLKVTILLAFYLGVVQRQKPIECPFPGCTKKVVRVDRHLINVHKIDTSDERYIEYVNLILKLNC